MTTESTPPDADGAPNDVPERFSVDFTGLTLLGIYRVDERLAEGGMGSVYLGHDTNLGRKVVIKVPHVKFLGERGFRTRFAREISELVRLEHPHIVRIIAQGVHADVPFFVLQYLGGGDLEQLLEKHAGGIALPELLPWMRTIATTLDFVHARGTIHRDVKPANVIFDAEGHVFLSDFGVAKALEGGEDANLTEAGTGIGSPRYMAPEQAYGRELTPTADQYALAAMLYEGLAGRPPFTETSPIELLVKKGVEDPLDIGDLVPDLPRTAAEAVMRGLARDPQARHPSCTEMLDRFEAALQPASAAAEPVQRSRHSLLVAAATLTVLIGAFLLFGRGAPDDAQDGATDDAGPMHLTLIDPGREPRRRLRYSVRPGDKVEITLSKQSRTTATMGDAQVGTAQDPDLSLQLALTIDGVDANGDIRVRWSVIDAAVGPGKDTGEAPAAPPKELTESYGALGGTFRLSPNGLTHEAVAADVLTQDEVRREVEILRWVIRTITRPFPVEAVGLGARWEIAETGDLIGMRLTHTRTCEMVALDGNEVTLNEFVAQTAPRQAVDLRVAPGQTVKATLVSLHTIGESKIRADLDHIAPRFNDFEMTVKMAYFIGSISATEKPDPAQMVDVTYAMKLKFQRP